jgi:hypothetical protein
MIGAKMRNSWWKQTELYMVLIQGIYTIFMDWLPNVHAFRKVHTMLAPKYWTVHHVDSQVWWRKGLIYSNINKILNAHPFYSVHKFLTHEDDSVLSSAT